MEYDIYTTEEFEQKFKKEELYWANLALNWGEEKYAGLLYAPWIHEEIIINNQEAIETVFYLMIFNEPSDWNLYVYYLQYTNEKSKSSIVAKITSQEITYRFSIHQVESIWDEEQWSEEYLLNDIPNNFKDRRFISLYNSIEIMFNKIKQIIPI